VRLWIITALVSIGVALPAEAQDEPAADAQTHADDPDAAPVPGEGEAQPADVIEGVEGIDAEAEEAPVSRPTPVAVTISGGASLGAYEAGVMHYSLEAMRGAPERTKPLVFAGTSAGSINAFISTLSHCTEAPRDPEASHFFRTWAAIGINELYVPEEVQPNALFSRDGFGRAVGALRRQWDAGLREDCDVLLGITVTRMRPREVTIEQDVLTLPRMAERFLVRIRGRGPGRPPLVENFVEPDRSLDRPLLPLDGPNADPFAALLETILASSCFPVAFAPQPIAHCVGTEGRCTPHQAETALFLDGGFYSNQPLGLAVDAVRMGVSADGPTALLEAPSPGRRVPLDTVFYFVDPELYAFPLPRASDGDDDNPDVIPFAMRMAGDFIRTARTAELHTVIEQMPEARKLLFTNRVHYPSASAGLGAFMGFFDREFRRFDFHLGMYDARRTLVERIPAGRGERGAWSSLPDEFERPPNAGLGWKPFDCMRYVFDGYGDPHSCAGEDLHDFRILLRISLERLWDICERTERASDMCDDARAGRPPPGVPYVAAEGNWRSQDGEAHYDWMLRRLATHRFAFRDLGLNPSRADEGDDAVRVLMADMTRSLARAQNDLSLPIELASEVVVNALQYRAPTNLVHIGFGTGLEIGWSGTRPGTALEWLRLTLALEFRGIRTLISSQPSYFGIVPLLGAELEILPLSGGIFQPRLGFRGGFIFSTGDGFLAGTCDVMNEEVIPCSRPVMQGYIALSFFQILRLLLIGEVQPAVRGMEPDLWEFLPGIALSIPLE